MSTTVEIRTSRVTLDAKSSLPWDKALDVVGRAFYPEGPFLGGPALPKLEKPQGRELR